MTESSRGYRAGRYAGVWGVTALLVHQTGNWTQLYFTTWWYQLVAHFCSASAVAGVVAAAGIWYGLRGRALLTAVVALAVVGALSWEAIEYLGWFPHLYFHSVADFAVDMVANAVGIATTALVVWRRVD